MSDPIFDTDLDARTLLEASAGTGKTYALAGLFVRAVILDGRRVPEILAVTYTVAATQELRSRVRLRLQQAAQLAVQWQIGDPALRDGDDADSALLRRLLHDAIARGREALPALRQRLASAARDIDLAAIHTIHGFCQRLLAEHAVDTGQPLLAADLETRNRAARTRLAVDLWRAATGDTGATAFLQAHFGGIDGRNGLSSALSMLLADEPLLPPAPRVLPDDPMPAIAAAWLALRDAYDAHGECAHAALHAAIDTKVLNNTRYKHHHVDDLWTWCARHAPDMPPAECHERLRKYRPEALLAGTSKPGAGRTPRSPLFAAIVDFIDAFDRLGIWHDARGLQRLHALREQARVLDALRKRAFHLRDYDDLIAAVHAAATDPAHARVLAGAVRAQFPLALVDEFQDTDARQWTIFRSLFGHGGLVLVGDAKQAIYRFRGGDVHTYLAARASADAVASLDHNFRSRPLLLDAVAAVFAAAPDDAMGVGIAFPPVQPGGRACDDDLQRDGVAAPALEVHVVPATIDARTQKEKEWNGDASIEIAAALCADAIRERLQLARDGRLSRRDHGALRAVEPRDCAVLVRTHREAEAVRRALSRCGVPAVAGGRISLFATEEAATLLSVLLALRNAGDDRRLRAALATRLLGQDAAALRVLDIDGDALRTWQQRFQDWRTRWERHGPQALLSEIVAANASRMLSEPDGERRVANLLQVAELLQEAGARSLGTQGQLDALRAAIATADAEDETQQPRLESDAGRVQILTLHKSKGLEFPLVFLPFIGIGRKHPKPEKWATYATAAGRVRQWQTSTDQPGAAPWDDGTDGCAVARHVVEEQAEDMRLLYVGLTRARDAVWLACGALASHGKTALVRLLGDPPMRERVARALGTHVTWSSGLPDDTPQRLAPMAAAAAPPARVASRVLRRDWWIHSFSQLHQQQSQGTQVLADAAPADDEPRAVDPRAVDPYDVDPRDVDSNPAPRDMHANSMRFGGVRFGNALHHALEHVRFPAWRDSDGAIPAGERDALLVALRHEHYREAELDDGARALAPLIARTLNALLPTVAGADAKRLCDLADADRIAELEFHFTLRNATTRDFVALLQRHGLLLGRHDFGIWHTLSGLMTGKLDLTYRVDDRLYVVDYKSNRLPGYDRDTLAERMAASEYDLQALLYAVALHRWLRLRRADYDFDRHFGGARYVFSRGLDPRDPAQGVFVPALSRELVEAADALLAPPLPEGRPEVAWD